MTGGATQPPGWIGPGLIASAALFIASAALFGWVSSQAAAPPPSGDIRVEVTARSCEPMALTVAAGKVGFSIHNLSDRPIEWEILDGPMVVEERENILPGLQAQLTARLKPGDYQITCGLLSNPRGSLRVLPSAQSEALRQAPPKAAFIGPLSEYRVYVLGGANALVKSAAVLEAALAAGDRAAAQAAWLAARQSYKRIEPVALRFAALESAIDPLPDYLAGREADPAYTGFHPIEAGLWGGAELASLQPLAAKLGADLGALREALKADRLAPEDLAPLAARQALQIAQGQAIAPQSPASGGDPADLVAAAEGIAKPLLLLLPLVAEANAALAAQLGAAMSAAQSPGAAGSQAREAFAAQLTEIAARAEGINPALGLE